MESLTLTLTTPAGDVAARIDVPSGFVPVTAIVPLMHGLGEQALALEERTAAMRGESVSCRKGCAACCRLLVPVSAPEAFRLRDRLAQLPAPRQTEIRRRMAEAERRLVETGLLEPLLAVAETEQQLTDQDLDAVNRAYYSQRLACPFLEDEMCSIYEDRPAACRELLVTSPADLCADIERNPVRALPVPVRISTALAQVWADLRREPARLIPLPIAVSWAERHAGEAAASRSAQSWLDGALDAVARYLSREFDSRRVQAHAGESHRSS